MWPTEQFQFEIPELRVVTKTSGSVKSFTILALCYQQNKSRYTISVCRPIFKVEKWSKIDRLLHINFNGRL